MKPTWTEKGCGAVMLLEMDPLPWEYACGDEHLDLCEECHESAKWRAREAYRERKEREQERINAEAAQRRRQARHVLRAQTDVDDAEEALRNAKARLTRTLATTRGTEEGGG